MTWLQAKGEESLLALHVQPGAKKTEVAGLHGAALKIRLAAPPVDGKANECLIAFLAQRLDVPKACVKLIAGQTSRSKRVSVSGVEAEEIRRLLSGRGSTKPPSPLVGEGLGERGNCDGKLPLSPAPPPPRGRGN